jgi:ornithine decarboxylase
MPFGSETELVKVAKVLLKAKLVFWIATNDSKAVCHLSIKFGATLKTSRLLLEQTKDIKIDIIRVS